LPGIALQHERCQDSFLKRGDPILNSEKKTHARGTPLSAVPWPPSPSTPSRNSPVQMRTLRGVNLARPSHAPVTPEQPPYVIRSSGRRHRSSSHGQEAPRALPTARRGHKRPRPKSGAGRARVLPVRERKRESEARGDPLSLCRSALPPPAPYVVWHCPKRSRTGIGNGPRRGKRVGLYRSD
jgi:hypothetical protein